MKLTVVQLVNTLMMGGAETLIKDYALLFDKNKFNVSIIVTGGKCNTVNEKILEENSIHVYYLGDHVGVVTHANAKYSKIYNLVTKQIILNNLLRKIAPDIIHAHLETAIYLTLYNSKKTKIFYTFHNELEKMFDTNKLFELSVARLISHKKATPIALHKEMALEINQRFQTNNAVVVNNGINLDRFLDARRNKEKIKNSLRVELGLPIDAYVIGHVGRFVHQKNHEFLINIFEAFNKRVTNTFLLLIGEGHLKKDIEQQLNKMNLLENVVFLENRGDIPHLMACMDVFVFPSHFEGFGNVLIEAQAVGVKCIMSDVVPKETIVTKETCSVSLDEPADIWVDTILNESKISNVYNTLDDLNIKKSVKQLEEMYQN